MEWLGTGRYGWQSVSGLEFRFENPPPPRFLWQPSHPPSCDVKGYGNGDQTIWLTLTLFYLAAWVKEGQAIPKNVYVLSTEWLVLPGFGLALVLVNKCLRSQSHHPYFCYLSSPPVIIFEESHHALVLPWSERKLFCFFAMVSPSFAEFAMRISVCFKVLVAGISIPN